MNVSQGMSNGVSLQFRRSKVKVIGVGNLKKMTHIYLA